MWEDKSPLWAVAAGDLGHQNYNQRGLTPEQKQALGIRAAGVIVPTEFKQQSTDTKIKALTIPGRVKR